MSSKDQRSLTREQPTRWISWVFGSEQGRHQAGVVGVLRRGGGSVLRVQQALGVARRDEWRRAAGAAVEQAGRVGERRGHLQARRQDERRAAERLRRPERVLLVDDVLEGRVVVGRDEALGVLQSGWNQELSTEVRRPLCTPGVNKNHNREVSAMKINRSSAR